MTTSTDALYELIKSMTSYEKKIFLEGDTDKSNNYQNILFKEISKSRHFNNENYQKALVQQGVNPSNFPKLKHDLYRSLLRFLATQQSKKNIRRELFEAISGVEVLMDRMLFEQAEKEVLRIKNRAIESNMFQVYFDILLLESRLIVSKKQTKDILKSNAILNEDINHMKTFYDNFLKLTTDKLQFFEDFMQFQESHANQYSIDSFVQKGYLKALYNGYVDSPMKAILKLEAGYLLAMDGYVKGEQHISLEIFKHLFEEMKKLPYLTESYPYRAFIIVNNLGDSAIIKGDVETEKMVFEFIRSYQTDSVYINNMIEEIEMNLISTRIGMGDLSKANKDDISDLTAKMLNKTRWIIPRLGVAGAIELVAGNYFTGNYRQANKLIQYINQFHKDNLDTLTVVAISITELIICAETKDADFLLSKLNSFRKLKYRRKAFLSLIARFFHQIAVNDGKKSIIQEFQLELQQFTTKDTAYIVERSNLSHWLEKRSKA